MSWNTDWPNGVSETITEIQTIASNQMTDEANISALQTAVNVIADSNTSTLPSVSSSDINANYWRVLAYGVSASGASAITLSCNGVQIASAPIGSSSPFLFEVHLFFDSSNGRMPNQPITPVGGSFSVPVISGSPSTLTFSLGGTSSVDSFWLQPA